jgi:ubiquinol-cytochrome c reductase cytochrome c1 subunit
MKKLIYIIFVSLSLFLVGNTSANASDSGIAWDKFPTNKLTDMAALQNGAKLFVNYCLNCHSAAFMRYNRLRDIQLSEEQIKKNLMFTTEKVGETMKATLDPAQAKSWFGGNPPDLTLVARSRADFSKGSGADYLYTYLRSYYRDAAKPTGWNNLAYPNVGMPHALWELQGQRNAVFVTEKDPHDSTKETHRFKGYQQLTAGKLTSLEYDDAVADLVGYMQWMGEPGQAQRYRLGVWVIIFLSLFTLIAWRLNAAFWKDIK